MASIATVGRGSMKIYIKRTSSGKHDNIQPCEEAIGEPYTFVDRRFYRTPEEIRDLAVFFSSPEQRAEWWYSEGTNHRAEGGFIIRDVKKHRWFMQVETLQELLGFIKKYQECIAGTLSLSDHDYLWLEIYDDYRE